jgi:hypothetical protein
MLIPPSMVKKNISQKEGRQPRFPMFICDRTFVLVAEQVQKLDYSGPVGFSCDDTKHFASWRLFWDSNVKTYYLVGGTAGPMQVADPEGVQAILDDPTNVKATKVHIPLLYTGLL